MSTVQTNVASPMEGQSEKQEQTENINKTKQEKRQKDQDSSKTNLEQEKTIQKGRQANHGKGKGQGKVPGGQSLNQPGNGSGNNRASGKGQAVPAPDSKLKETRSPNKPKPLNMERRMELLNNMPKTLKEIFLAEPVEEIAFRNWQQRRTVLISDDKLLERTLSRISKHNIHAMPVISATDRNIIGTIEVLDIIHALISAIDKVDETSTTIQQNVRKEFMNKKVSEYVSKNSYVISAKASLYDAVKGFVEHQQDRFVIVDRIVEGGTAKFGNTENDVVGMLTTSDILRFLVSNSYFMREEPLFSKSLKELGLKEIEPKVVNSKEVVAEAFKQMGKYGHDGLAVVDDEGKLIGNLSACDLKGVTRFNCPILNSSVQDFLNRDQKREWFSRPIVLEWTDSLYLSIHQFVSLAKRRFYFVDKAGKPTGEVSRREVIEQLWKVIQ